MMNSKIKNICVVTGSRAEYGLLIELIKKIKDEKKFKLQLIVTGTHLSKKHGYTIKEIYKDKIRIDSKIILNLKKDKGTDLAYASGQIIDKASRSFAKLSPDLVIVLGDRYEILSIALAATLMQIPIAHIHGGEITEGSIDEQMRHAITKLSHLHFVSHKDYRKRVIQMGEMPSSVHVVGAMGIENIKKIEYLNKSQLEKSLKIKLRKKNLLVTFHSETRKKFSISKITTNLLKALDKFKDINIIFTMPNSDLKSNEITLAIQKYVKLNKDRTYLFKSLGQKKYLSLLNHVDGMIGNSSSGIIENPSFKKGTVNIGTRQQGRIKADSIIDCDTEVESIIKSIKKLYSKSFEKRLKKVVNPYEKNNSSYKCIQILKKVDIKKIYQKKFSDFRQS